MCTISWAITRARARPKRRSRSRISSPSIAWLIERAMWSQATSLNGRILPSTVWVNAKGPRSSIRGAKLCILHVPFSFTSTTSLNVSSGLVSCRRRTAMFRLVGLKTFDSSLRISSSARCECFCSISSSTVRSSAWAGMVAKPKSNSKVRIDDLNLEIFSISLITRRLLPALYTDHPGFWKPFFTSASLFVSDYTNSFRCQNHPLR